MNSTFRQRSEKALNDKRLQRTMRNAADVFRGHYIEGCQDLFDHDGMRDRAAEVKRRCLAHLPDLLEQLEANIQKLGGTVHWAKDGEAANAIIADIARTENVKRVVKGKSMVTEETGLNAALEAQGVEVTETDLGEWIVQLAGEAPSHIVAPAAHKDRGEISDLFQKHIGTPPSDNIPELTLMARRALRKKFLAADMGITGANMAIADTGSIVLVENEGNIRLSTTLPRVHVSVMSLEKVVANPDDMATLLALLPRSCTGQTLSSYTSVITGPRQPGEADGAEVFHLVILDNGRSALSALHELNEILCCIRCGACINSCPVYVKAGGHSYGSAYSGPMGSILAPLLNQDADNPFADLPFACTTCGACAKVCPVRIDHPRLLLKLRQRYAAQPHNEHNAPMTEGAASSFAWLASHSGLYKTAMAVARTLDPSLTLAQRLPGMSKPLGLFGRKRQLPELKRPFSKDWTTKTGKNTDD